MFRLASFFRDTMTPIAVLFLGVVVRLDHWTSHRPISPNPKVDGVALGRLYAPAVTSTLSAGWLAAADALAMGRSVAESQAVLQDTWKQARTEFFLARIAPEFALILGEGVEPTSPAQRAAVVQLWRDFAAGLKGDR